MHSEPLKIDIEHELTQPPLEGSSSLTWLMWCCVGVGVAVFLIGWVWYDPKLFWGAYLTNLVFWTGLACGPVILAAIFQIVRAKWSPPVRRLAEASVAFLPWSFILILLTYFGREYLYPWGGLEPMPGREWWFQPWLVYLRFAVLFAVLFSMMGYFVLLSVRGDIGLLRERSAGTERWHSNFYARLVTGWRGSEVESGALQVRLSCLAPVLIIVYVLVYSLFAFDMVMSMDKIWYANMFGGFFFVGNIYLGIAALTLIVIYCAARYERYRSVLGSQQLWDLGKLAFGFCMLWGYLFFSHFLPQWYGNLPEETQWLILRSREYPWKAIGWIAFGMCFVIPFITLLSRDLKRTPSAFAVIALVVFFGVWFEKYIIIMPQVSPDRIPLGVIEIGLFFGFLGAYILSVQAFMRKFPYVPVSHPLSRGSADW